jgi:two-component system, OmpR family, phosphate regulon sensor histidine kinase PhoR
MRPNRKRVGVLITMMAIALTGLIVLQLYLLEGAFELKEQAFRQNVWSALLSASLRLQAGQTMAQAFKVDLAQPRHQRIIRSETGVASGNSVRLSETAGGLGGIREPLPLRIEENTFTYRVGSPKRVRVQISDAYGRDSILIDSVKSTGEHAIPIPKGKGGFFYRFTTDSNSVVATVVDGTPGKILPRPASDSARFMFVSRVIDNLWNSGLQPVEKRYPHAVVDSVVRQSIREAGIPLDVSYGILTHRSDSSSGDTVHLASPVGAEPTLLASEFHTPLSPWNAPMLGERLVVDFPGRQLYLLGQLWPAFLSSVVFVALILGTFVYTVRTILKQQRLSGQMVDFVNTMTHEFKTPISTIALTSEAIRRPDVIRRTTKVLQYNAIIAEEAARMKKQVDRILQMAQIEEGDFELSVSDVSVHELIRSIVSNFAVQVESRGGTITLELAASASVVRADTVHLGNLLRSLLDNANKYSPITPQIAVRTRNRDGGIEISVADRGMGIPVEFQKRVFDKYFRVPQGNVHDVKGFGLGLSYVKLIVEAHGGTINLESVEDVGTTVTIHLPALEQGTATMAET